MRRVVGLTIVLALALLLVAAVNAQKQPNILVIWGDDIGQSNISAYTMGLSKVGLPGSDLGMREEEPTSAGLFEARGYMTGQFG